MTYGAAFLTMWIGFAAMTLAGLGAALWWAIKSGQFKDQDRARYLPLMSGIPGEEDEKEEKKKCSATT